MQTNRIRGNTMKLIKCIFMTVALLSTQALAQTAGAPLAPKDSAVDMSVAELAAAAQHLKDAGISTKRMLEGGIFSVNVRHIQGAETALQHGRISEVWVIQSGSGIVATGGELVDKQAGSRPGEFSGSAIRGGHERRIQAGDVVFVPPGVPHGIKQTDSIVYLNIRFELRDED
jgi:mannose-6-phosphate isomerase-like protein (cupin superfamily)